VFHSVDNGDGGVMAQKETEVVNQDKPWGSLGVFRGGESNQIGFKWVETVDDKIWHLEARAHNLLKMAGSNLKDSKDQEDN